MLLINLPYPSYDSLLAALVDTLDPRNYSTYSGTGVNSSLSDGLISRFGGMICEGTEYVSLELRINSKQIFGGCQIQAIDTWRVLLEFNNALYTLLQSKKSARMFITHFGQYKGTTLDSKGSSLYFVLELRGAKLLISSTRPIQGVFLQNESVHFYQIVEEVVRSTKEYTEAVFEAVRKISPDALKRIKNYYFNSEKILHSDTPWLPLEQAWLDYKKQHNITDEDVKKVIAEEEEKEKRLQKKWWQVWR